MSDKEKDQIIWNTIVSFYNEPKKKNKRIWTSEQLEQTRKMNQEESYWCREDGKDQKLFIKPEQRLMARLTPSPRGRSSRNPAGASSHPSKS